MPTPAQILEGLTIISNNYLTLAVIWHVVIGLAILGIILGWRPSRRLGASVLCLPLLSVSVLAWANGNPFNGAVFLLAAVALLLLGLRLPAQRVEAGPLWASAIGVLMLAFGWVYPHFLAGRSWLTYLYAAPMGLVPCPTLSVAVGFALIARGLGSRAWGIVLAVVGLFYGLFGALRLGVRIDAFLCIGALALLIQSLAQRTQRPA
jgi:hypothetical protein